MKKFIVTSALPYANGKLHIGHVAGAYLPADIFVRYLRLKDNDVVFVCGTDEHGAPISILAESEKVKPQDIVNKYHQSIYDSFTGLNIQFDNFSGTARPPHHKLAQEFFLNLLENGYINVHTNQQFFCVKCNRFLADRYVEGICPYCHKDGARGDQCDSCGKLMDTITLKEPKCKICGGTPEIRDTSHWFLNLPAFEEKLKEWLKTKEYWKENILRFILGLLEEGLKERAITRDIDWGIPVPLENAEGKVLYVWFEAPIGYISSTMEWCQNQGKPDLWKEYWLDQETKLVQFIGKDNNIFHAIFWPAILMGQKKKYVLPHDIPANEFLNLEGQKISTSRNWAIWIDDFLKDFHGDLLRYYLAAIAPESKDSDFSWKEFQDKVNGELANTLGNLANRVFLFATKNYSGIIRQPESFQQISQECLDESDRIIAEIDECLSTYKVRRAVKLMMDIARNANKYFDDRKPWEAVKYDRNGAEETLYTCLTLLKKLSVVFYPIIPSKMIDLRKMFNLNLPPKWDELNTLETKFEIQNVEPLFPRIEDEVIEEQLKKLYQTSESQKALEHKDFISYDDFVKLELRVAEVIRAEAVPKSDKLLKLSVKIANEERTVVSGIAKHYKPEELVGKKVAMLLNLHPRKIFGIESQGMILAASNDDEKLTVIVPSSDIDSGTIIS